MTDDEDQHEDCLKAVCADCEQWFVLTLETTRKDGFPKMAGIDIRSCESGGVYAASVTCPHCGHKHDLDD